MLIGFVAAGLLAAGATTGAADPSDPAHLAYKTHDAEQFKTIPIARPRAGDTYWVESKYVARVGHLPYSVAMRNELFLGRHKRSNDPKGAYRPTEYPVVSPRNGWTCTRGPSGHQSPCVIQKGGVLRFDRNSNETFHLNLTVGASASLLDKQHYRAGRVHLGNGYLRIYEFDNTI